MFLDTSNFSKTQLRNSLKVLKHTFSSVKVKHFLSLKNDDFEFNTVLARAGVRAARSNYILEKFNISAFTEKKSSQKLIWFMFYGGFRSLCLYGQRSEEYFKKLVSLGMNFKTCLCTTTF